VGIKANGVVFKKDAGDLHERKEEEKKKMGERESVTTQRKVKNDVSGSETKRKKVGD